MHSQYWDIALAGAQAGQEPQARAQGREASIELNREHANL